MGFTFTALQGFEVILGGRQIGRNEIPAFRTAESAWVSAGFKPKTLIKQIVTSEHYCAR